MLRYFLMIFLAVNLVLSNVAFANDAKFQLSVKTFENEQFDLEEKQGKVVVVVFWAWWCPNCTKELAILDELYRQYQHQGLEIIGMSVDSKDDLNKTLSTARTVSFPSALMLDANLHNFGSIVSIPETFIFDRQGRLFGKNIYQKETWDKVMKELI